MLIEYLGRKLLIELYFALLLPWMKNLQIIRKYDFDLSLQSF